jgi:hypothetical protein
MKVLHVIVLTMGWLILLPVISVMAADEPAAGVRLATFDIDATPPLGSMMAYDAVRRVDELGLRCRGIVLLGAGEPIVLCAVDWIGISNEGHDAFRQTLAKAAGTTPARVAVHTLHQHDAPACDFTAERLLHAAGSQNLGRIDGSFARTVLARLDPEVRAAVARAEPITHAGVGSAEVKEVASNRRIKGPDGRVRVTRYTATKDPELRAEPEGVIDPVVSTLSFWNAEKPLAVLSYYACHPQSYYRTGIPSPDFPGIARFIRGQAVPDALHVHFNGAGGNIGAGKYNDGSQANRVALATRLADGMQRALDATHKFPLTAADIGWTTVGVSLPVAKHLDEAKLRADLATFDPKQFFGAADELAWLLRMKEGHQIDLACLRVGEARVLHMPGELFVEYQLAAKAMRPDLKVMMAAYGDYAPGYIGTAAAYGEGGYETSPRSSHVAPECEEVLLAGVRKLLEVAKPVAAPAATHVKVYAVPGRPANHGGWSWGNEILVGFSAGYAKDNGPKRHAIDHDRPEEHLLARSRDGGQTWSIENPAEQGALIPVGSALHGITPPGLKERPWEDCPGGIDFTHPDFALTVRMTDANAGPSRFSYSIDRGKSWLGPFRLPLFEQPGIAARTDYVVNGKHDCLLLLTSAKRDGREGRPLCVRTTDGGKSWQFTAWIAEEPRGYAIMPSTVRIGGDELLSAIRCRDGAKSWIDTYRSVNLGQHWSFDQTAVPDTGEGNPPSLIRLTDGRLCLTYGYRAEPFGIRARLSRDGGRTWEPELTLRSDGGGRDVGYPRSFARPDGKVVTVYYFHDEPLSDRYIAATIWQP